MITRFLITMTLTASVAIAGDLDRKSPPPIREPQSCLRVEMTQYVRTTKCVAIDPLILRKYGLRPGGEVSAADLVYLHEESEKLRRKKMR